jgi:hypothetical protein
MPYVVVKRRRLDDSLEDQIHEDSSGLCPVNNKEPSGAKKCI